MSLRLSFCICLLLTCSIAAQAQTDTAFNTFAQKQNAAMVSAYRQKNTAAYMPVLNTFLQRYNKLTPADQLLFKGYVAGAYYNLSCTYGLLNEKDKALEYLEKSTNAGYTDYAHINVDTDLDNIRNEVKYKALVQSLRETNDYLYILKKGAQYDANDKRVLPAFTYQSAKDAPLAALAKLYNLDSIAGQGNETSKVINLLHWVHNTVPHDGQHESGIKNINAWSIITAAKTQHIGVSCGELASTLNDCYLAMGWASRKVYCFPKDSLNNDHDSHVINVVYLPSKKKWVWIDPTNDAYVMDETGELLSIEEVRERLISGKPLLVNPDANWNHKASMTKEDYLDNYMAKNLYRIYSPLNSRYDYETWGRNEKVAYINLIPLNYSKPAPLKTDDYYNANLNTTFNRYYTFNNNSFWQAPQ